MSLPSQSSRNATRSSQVHYRRSSAGPLRKFLSIAVILGIIFIVWFLFIRPQASKLAADEQSNEQTNEQLNQELAANDSQPESAPTIINNSPSRPLPGAGNRPDSASDVKKTLNSNTRSDPTFDNSPSSTTRPQSNNPASNPSNTDILSSAANQARNQPSAQPQTQPQTNNNPAGIRLQLDAARRLIAENNRVQARKLLSQTLLNADITADEAQYLRDELTVINNQLLFSPVKDPKDSMTEMYTIKSGDSLSRIAGRRELATHWKLIARINQIADPAKIRLGQSLKLVRGPFHAIVNKSAHRLDLYHGSPSDPSAWLYIKSFDVGLGSNDGTPIGEFVVSANKLENPGWVNPRNAREQYEPNDPANPIGEFWIGLTGQGQYSNLTSLGIHGTIDQNSIGGDESMGCVRLAVGDIDTVYELLAEHLSRVLIVP